MGTTIPAGARQFRMGLLPAMAFIFVAGMGLGTLLVAARFGVARVVWLLLLQIGLFWGLPCAFFWAVLLHWFFPAAVSEDGIYGHSFWGKRCHLRWAEMARARRFRLGNLIWLRIYSGAGRAVLWLPLFQSRPAEFRETIRQFAPAGNPVLPLLGGRSE